MFQPLMRSPVPLSLCTLERARVLPWPISRIYIVVSNLSSFLHNFNFHNKKERYQWPAASLSSSGGGGARAAARVSACADNRHDLCAKCLEVEEFFISELKPVLVKGSPVDDLITRILRDRCCSRTHLRRRDKKGG